MLPNEITTNKFEVQNTLKLEQIQLEEVKSDENDNLDDKLLF